MQQYSKTSWTCSLILILVGTLISSASAQSAELLVGAATVSITPDQPVALWGQLHTRISQAVESPVTATALALESRDGETVLDQAILVSCDLALIPALAVDKIRERVRKQLPDFPVDKITISVTHTHTAPVLIDGIYEIPKEGVMQPTDYIEFFADRVAEVVLTAWDSRRPGKVSWGLSQAVIAHN